MEPVPPCARRFRASVRITDRDRELLAFAAEHRLVLGEHVRTLLGISAGAAQTRMRALTRAGFLARHAVLERGPGWHQITRQGLAVSGSKLPVPREDLRSFDHDVGVAWLWLAARDGAFGPLAEVVSERRLRSVDGARDRGEQPYGIRRGGHGPRGGERLHYPDLLLRTPGGRRVALELELTLKSRVRLEQILVAYGADRRIDRVVYLVETRAIAGAIEAAARKVGVAELVYIQPVRRPLPEPADPRAVATERTGARTSGVSRVRSAAEVGR